jgi:hypothetical protein
MGKNSSSSTTRGRAANRTAAEDDAREMLLASGVSLSADNQKELVDAVLRGAGGPPRELYTIAEFCEVMAISESTYFRAKRAGHGPREVELWGRPRITREEVDRWKLANLEPRDDSPQLPLPEVPMAMRKRRRGLTMPNGQARDSVMNLPPVPPRGGRR